MPDREARALLPLMASVQSGAQSGQLAQAPGGPHLSSICAYSADSAGISLVKTDVPDLSPISPKNSVQARSLWPGRGNRGWKGWRGWDVRPQGALTPPVSSSRVEGAHRGLSAGALRAGTALILPRVLGG